MRTAPRPSTASDHPQSPSGRQAEHFGGTSAPSRFTASAQPLSTAKRLPHRNPRSQFSKHPAATMFEDDGDSSDGEGLQHASPHDIIPANGFHGTTADILRSPLRTSSSSVEEFQVEPLRVVGSSAGNCLICQGFFQRLERHMLTHTDERPFECKECPGRFKQRGHLVRHIASKHTKCLLRCKYCGKHLTRKDKLKQHMLLTCRIIREY